MSSAKEVLEGVLEDVNETLIDDWIKKMEGAGKDPLVYARALALKAKRPKGCDGFFVSLHRQNTEDEWLEAQLRKAKAVVVKETRQEWPYPDGHWNCRTCAGRGWYASSTGSLSDEDNTRLEDHQNNGYIPVTYRETDLLVFICSECNPEGSLVPEYEGKILARHPVGGVASLIDPCPF